MKLPYIKLLQKLDLMLLSSGQEGERLVHGECVESLMLLRAPLRQRLCTASSMEEVPMIFSAVLTTLCSDFLSHGVQLTNQREMAGQDTPYGAPWWWGQEGERCGLLFQHRKCSCWAHLTRNNVLSNQSRLSVICTTETWYYWLPPLHCQWWMGSAWAGLCWSQWSSHLIYLLNVQDQIVDSASVHQSLHLLLIGQVLVFPNETHPCCVICILDDMIRSRCSAAVKDLGHIPEEGSWWRGRCSWRGCFRVYLLSDLSKHFPIHNRPSTKLYMTAYHAVCMRTCLILYSCGHGSDWYTRSQRFRWLCGHVVLKNWSKNFFISITVHVFHQLKKPAGDTINLIVSKCDNNPTSRGSFMNLNMPHSMFYLSSCKYNETMLLFSYRVAAAHWSSAHAQPSAMILRGA